MIGFWWLFLIVPVSACIGYITCGLILTAKILDEPDIDNSAGN